MWFDLSAGNALGEQHDVAARARLAMRERMMPAQVEEARLSARHWISCAGTRSVGAPSGSLARLTLDNEKHELLMDQLNCIALAP
jgi:hypothetical protein